MSLITEGFGTIKPLGGSHKIGLDNSEPPTVKAVLENVVAKWTVQNSDPDTLNCYRLFVNNGENDYALNVTGEDEACISTFEGSPASSGSHPWYIFRFPDEYYYIQDMTTHKAWKLNGTIELALLPTGNDGLEPFKFSFTFSG